MVAAQDSLFVLQGFEFILEFVDCRGCRGSSGHVVMAATCAMIDGLSPCLSMAVKVRQAGLFTTTNSVAANRACLAFCMPADC